MIQGIFYARFSPIEGPKIVAQSPPGCIVPTPSRSGSISSSSTSSSQPPSPTTIPAAPAKPPLIDFDIVQEYIIPRKSFFNRFTTVLDPEGRYVILGFPILIPHTKYHRNEFIFNFGIILDDDAEQAPYEPVVRRLAVTFAEMEKQDEYLSSQERETEEGGGDLGDSWYLDGGIDLAGEKRRRADVTRRPIESLLEIVREDLNNYGECMIPVDDANTINMKLFPHHPPPPLVKGWHVPVPKTKLSSLVDPTWDLTLQKIIAHIDGVSDVRRIAFQADVSLELATLALRHLLYYDVLLLLDLFFFSSCYAPCASGIHDFITDVDGVLDECAAYVSLGSGTAAAANTTAGGASSSGAPPSTSGSVAGSVTGGSADVVPYRVDRFQLIRLMTSFCVGKSVMEWLRGHQEAGFDVLRHIDVRRFVQFGIIKGCLYRVHKYVVSKQYLASLATGHARPGRAGARSAPEAEAGTELNGDGGDGRPVDVLQKYTDGGHCFDQIITERNMTDGEILEGLKRLPLPNGDLTVFYK